MILFLFTLITCFLSGCSSSESKYSKAHLLITTKMETLLARPDSFRLIDSGRLEMNYISSQYSDSLYIYCDSLIKISEKTLAISERPAGDTISMSCKGVIYSLRQKINAAKIEQMHQFNGYRIEIQFTAKGETGVTSLNRAAFYFDPEISEITQWDEYNTDVHPYTH